ncbi:MAG: hypothetical protein INR65_14930 [Gluconacetobacter diazotrophicus]|nr:hypothetical protein [Gluconacetobacter diazotrophicus]
MRLSASTFRPALLGGFLLAAVSSPAFSAGQDPGVSEKPDGTVTIIEKSADIGIGGTWGSGTLHWHGHSYPFTLKGGDIGAVGYSKTIGHGRVYNLKKLEDFNGTYAAANGAVTAGSGVGGQALVNGSNVGLRIDQKSSGGRLAGAAQGIQIELAATK